jgi:two-component system, NtrC family, sensor histidine kinase HydH
VKQATETSSLASRALDFALAKVIRKRVLIAPAMGSIALTFAFFEPTTWRRVLLGCAVTALFALSLIEWLRYRKYGVSVVLVPLNVIVTVLAQLALMTGSGGLFSPVVPAILIMVVLTGLLAERRTSITLLLIVIPYFWLLAYVHSHDFIVSSLWPEVFGGPQAFEHSPAPWTAATLYTIMFNVAARVAYALQGLFQDLFSEAMQERDRSLALHSEQSRTLTLLTSEIAHELKNPLASIKGLAMLVAKDSEGRAKERITVLRGEVDRMQTILDEFLNFSRPIVPLRVSETNLSELAHDVARLHEGSAAEHGLVIEVDAPEQAALACDARKVRQVLINLLQNAIDASPRGGRVTLRVEHGEHSLRALIIDHGAGLLPELRDRLFEAGVTSKKHGSGIGLVVARALCRQHGGDVTLTANPSGGVIAMLELPRKPEGVSA